MLGKRKIKELTLNIYLKSRKKPLSIIINREAQMDEFYRELMTKDICRFGPLIFSRNDFLYATLD